MKSIITANHFSTVDGKSVAAWLKTLGNKKAKYRDMK